MANWVAAIIAALVAAGGTVWKVLPVLIRIAVALGQVAKLGPTVDSLNAQIAGLTGEMRGWRTATDARIDGIENRLNSLNGTPHG